MSALRRAPCDGTVASCLLAERSQHMKRNIRFIAVVLLGAALAGCDGPSASSVKPGAYPTGMEGRPIAVRTSVGGEERNATLVEPWRTVSLTELAAAVREAGYGCETVRFFDQLELDGKRLDVHKVDCLEYSYQVTFGNGRSHVERWTGIIGNVTGSDLPAEVH